MAVSIERKELLEELAEAVRDLFPAPCEFTRHPESDHNFIVCWRLSDRGNNLTTRAREISIKFRESWLRDFERTTNQDRQAMKNGLHATAHARLVDYDDGSDFRKDQHIEPFVITMPDDSPD